MFGVLFHETSDTEFFGVEGINQLPDPLGALLEFTAPRPELGSAQIILFES